MSTTAWDLHVVHSFSGLANAQEGSEEREYCSQLFYLGQPNSCQIDYVVTWNVQAHLTVSVHVYEFYATLYYLCPQQLGCERKVCKKRSYMWFPSTSGL